MHRALAHDLIWTYSREDDLVCDPFAGACTTGEQAVLMGRDFVGFEIHEPYYEMGRRRLWAATDHVRRGRLQSLRTEITRTTGGSRRLGDDRGASPTREEVIMT